MSRSDVCFCLSLYSDVARLQFAVRGAEVHRLHADRGAQGDTERHIGPAGRRVLPGNNISVEVFNIFNNLCHSHPKALVFPTAKKKAWVLSHKMGPCKCMKRQLSVKRGILVSS